eukprot:3521028-Pyramimonas_sp.AAC.1
MQIGFLARSPFSRRLLFLQFPFEVPLHILTEQLLQVPLQDTAGPAQVDTTPPTKYVSECSCHGSSQHIEQ